MAPPTHRPRRQQRHADSSEEVLSFGAWLRQRRRALDLTQEELAQRIGCARITIRRIEADELKPSKALAELFGEHLGVPLAQRQEWLQFARGLGPVPAFNTSDSHGISPTLPAAPLTSLSAPFPSSLGREQAHVDWGEAPDVSLFCGRDAELAHLQEWMVGDRCRLVAVLGMGGQGKTMLVTMVASQVESMFARIIWRSLRNAPPVEELLGQCIQVVSNHQVHELPPDVDKRITLLMECLRQQRCLLVLDNYETVLQSERAGHYLAGYEGYGQLLQRVGEGKHQSCLLLSSREKPKELVALEGEIGPVRTLHLASLLPADSRALLQGKGLSGSPEEWTALHERYSGNPLALKIVAETIRELFAGQIATFLQEDVLLFDNIRDLLAQQFTHLSPLEQEVMVWLAVEREAVGIEELQADLVQTPPKLALLEALRSLRQRSLVERTETGFTLQNVVLEYLTAFLIEQVYTEITRGPIRLLHRHALLKAQAKSYVRESQRHLILAPLANRLVEQRGRQGTLEQLSLTLAELRRSQPRQPGYAGGNLLNLWVQLKGNLRGLDFSQLAMWQADLCGVDAQDVNFTQTDLANARFTDTFGVILNTAFSPDSERFAAATSDGDVRVWRAKDGQPLLTCLGHSGWVSSVCFSPDGKLLASGGSDDRTVRLWDSYSGQCLHTLYGHTGRVFSVCFRPDGKLLASSSDDQTVRLWDSHSGQCLHSLQGHTNLIRSVSFSPDGKTLASGSFDQTVRLWDVAAVLNPSAPVEQCLVTLQGHRSEVYSVAFSPDGAHLASSSVDGAILLWDSKTRACVQTLRSGRPYERMNIAGARGLTEAQRTALQALGAIEEKTS